MAISGLLIRGVILTKIGHIKHNDRQQLPSLATKEFCVSYITSSVIKKTGADLKKTTYYAVTLAKRLGA